MRIAYFVHDLGDAAVQRRIQMLRAGGAEVALFGFRRLSEAPGQVGGVVPVDLGQTRDGRLGLRAAAVLKRWVDLRRWSGDLSGFDVFMARQLEMLPLAARARAQHAPGARLVYELLDVHRSMLGHNAVGKVLRAIEGRLLSQADSVVISSPAFEREYLAKWNPAHPPTILVENKVYPASALGTGNAAERAPGPPWRIGWFGVIRCKRSLQALRRLVLELPGLVEVDIRGVRANTDLGDFERIVAETPGLRFHGRYSNPQDLPSIYGAVHFTWAIDFFEAGLNSTWLLPNRLYEGGANGAPAIALAGVETADWLSRRGQGLIIAEPLETELIKAMRAMTPERWLSMREAARSLPPEACVADVAECVRLVQALGEPRRASTGPGKPQMASAPGTSL